jgi:hypothetical protein
LAYSSTLKMIAKCSSETSSDFQRTIRRYIPEYRTLRLYFLLQWEYDFFTTWAVEPKIQKIRTTLNLGDSMFRNQFWIGIRQTAKSVLEREKLRGPAWNLADQ